MRSLEMLAEDMPVQAVAFDLGDSCLPERAPVTVVSLDLSITGWLYLIHSSIVMDSDDKPS